MNIIEAIRASLVTIFSNKIRSFLTILGMIIGVGSVIALISIGKGVYHDVSSLVMDMGTNIVFVVSGDVQGMTSGSTQTGFSNPANFIKGDIFTYDDVNKIRALPEVERAAAINMVSGVIFNQQDRMKKTAPIIMGVEPEAEATFQNIKIKTGRYHNHQDDHKKVMVISKLPAKALFGEGVNPVGKKVYLNKDEFEIIGEIYQPKSEVNIINSDFDNVVLIPFATANDLIGKTQILRILIKVKDEYNAKDVAKKIKETLLESHTEDEVSVLTQEDMLDLMGNILNILTTMISLIAAISLLVGGVGIMNIMLVSVTERTREIGIRKAIGATNGEILKQFLIEAVILTFIGGLIGVGLAYLAGIIFEAKTNISAVIDWQTISLAVGISVAIGIIFGLFPAIRAAKKDPVIALRYE